MKKAFTLIELLVVVLIIGILAAIALPQYQKAVARSRYKQLKITAQAIAHSQEIFYLANNEYASTFDQLDFVTPDKSTTTSTYFSNFHCELIKRERRIACRSSSIAGNVQMLYEIYLQHSDYPNRKKCSVSNFNENSLLNQVCKAETGLTTYSDKNQYTMQWFYPN